MTKHFANLFCLLITTLTIGATARASGPACQSQTLCVHAKMPSLDQRDTSQGTGYDLNYNGKAANAIGFDAKLHTIGLLQYVNKMNGTHLTFNTGWCGGSSASMLLKSYAEETQKFPSFLSQKDVNSFMYQTFKLVKTDMRGSSGTDTGDVKNGFEKLYGGSKAYKQSSLPSVASYRSSRPHIYLGIRRNGDENGHAVAVNGTEGSYYIIYDPQGRIFHAKPASASSTSKSFTWHDNIGKSGSPYYTTGTVNIKSGAYLIY